MYNNGNNNNCTWWEDLPPEIWQKIHDNKSLNYYDRLALRLASKEIYARCRGTGASRAAMLRGRNIDELSGVTTVKPSKLSVRHVYNAVKQYDPKSFPNMALSKDKFIVYLNGDGKFKCFNIKNNQDIPIYNDPSMVVMVFAICGDCIAGIYYDSKFDHSYLKVVRFENENLTAGKTIKVVQLNEHSCSLPIITAVDNKTIAYIYEHSNKVTFLDIYNGSSREMTFSGCKIRSLISIGRDSGLIACGYRKKNATSPLKYGLLVFDLKKWEIVYKYDGPTATNVVPIDNLIAFENQLVLGWRFSESKETSYICIWDIKSQELVSTFKLPSVEISCIIKLSNYRFAIVSRGNEDCIKIYSLFGQQENNNVSKPANIQARLKSVEINSLGSNYIDVAQIQALVAQMTLGSNDKFKAVKKETIVKNGNYYAYVEKDFDIFWCIKIVELDENLNLKNTLYQKRVCCCDVPIIASLANNNWAYFYYSKNAVKHVIEMVSNKGKVLNRIVIDDFTESDKPLCVLGIRKNFLLIGGKSSQLNLLDLTSNTPSRSVLSMDQIHHAGLYGFDFTSMLLFHDYIAVIFCQLGESYKLIAVDVRFNRIINNSPLYECHPDCPKFYNMVKSDSGKEFIIFWHDPYYPTPKYCLFKIKYFNNAQA